MAEMFGGLRLGLLMTVGVILLLLTAISIVPAFPGGGVDNSRRHRRRRTHALAHPTTRNIQSFMGAIMSIGRGPWQTLSCS